jgi:hypothetical protein
LAPLYQQAIEEISAQASISHVQTFIAHNLVVVVAVKHYAGIALFGFDDLGIIQPEINRVGFLIII